MKYLLLLAALFGCQPELPTRACNKDGDCFSQEVCVEKQCVTARGEAEGDVGALPDVALPETADASGDAAP